MEDGEAKSVEGRGKGRNHVRIRIDRCSYVDRHNKRPVDVVDTEEWLCVLRNMRQSFWRALFMHRHRLDRQGVFKSFRVAGRGAHCFDLFCDKQYY